MRFIDDFDASGPGVHRYNFAWSGYGPPAFEEAITKRRHFEQDRDRRLTGRRRLPAWRIKSQKSKNEILCRREDQVFTTDGTAQFQHIALSNVCVFKTGISFDIDLKKPGNVNNVTVSTHHVSNSAKKQKLFYLGIVLPSGSIVSNQKTALRYAPADDDSITPWLHAGALEESSTHLRASYFLSPHPGIGGELTFTISSTPLGIESGLSVSMIC
ncbi:MAG: hypothetical protein WBA00_12795 [Rhodococcus sp. (in: high G+C Gram-positive bacteria)]